MRESPGLFAPCHLQQHQDKQGAQFPLEATDAFLLSKQRNHLQQVQH